MSAGACADSVCGTSFGTVTVTGDTTSNLTFVVDLASDVDFHGNHSGSSGAGPVFYFDLTAGGKMISFSNIGDKNVSHQGAIGGKAYYYNAPTGGSFAPNAGNFPGTYNYEVTCTNSTSGKICAPELTFTASGADASNPFDIVAPASHGNFASDAIEFVADLSISAGSTFCSGRNACSGLVGSTLRMPAAPESSTWVMMLVGFTGLGFASCRVRHPGLHIVSAFREQKRVAAAAPA